MCAAMSVCVWVLSMLTLIYQLIPRYPKSYCKIIPGTPETVDSDYEDSKLLTEMEKNDPHLQERGSKTPSRLSILSLPENKGSVFTT